MAMRRPSADLEQMQESMSLMEEGLQQMNVNMQSRDAQWGQMSEMCESMSKRQEETVSVANHLVDELAVALNQIKDDQKVMKTDMHTCEAQWTQASNLCVATEKQYEHIKLSTDTLVRELSEAMSQLRVDQMGMQQTAAASNQVSAEHRDGILLLGESEQHNRRDINEMEKMSSMCKKQLEAHHNSHLEEVGSLKRMLADQQQIWERSQIPLRESDSGVEMNSKETSTVQNGARRSSAPTLTWNNDGDWLNGRDRDVKQETEPSQELKGASTTIPNLRQTIICTTITKPRPSKKTSLEITNDRSIGGCSCKQECHMAVCYPRLAFKKQAQPNGFPTTTLPLRKTTLEVDQSMDLWSRWKADSRNRQKIWC